MGSPAEGGSVAVVGVPVRTGVATLEDGTWTGGGGGLVLAGRAGAVVCGVGSGRGVDDEEGWGD